jgi:hypothetical protein
MNSQLLARLAAGSRYGEIVGLMRQVRHSEFASTLPDGLCDILCADADSLRRLFG